MGVTVKGLDNVLEKLNNKSDKIDKLPAYLVIVASDIRGDILKRTRDNQSVSGSAFHEYSKSYQSYKVKNAKEAFRTTTPNLSFTGQMLRSMSVKKIKNGAKIYFNSAEEEQKAIWNQFGKGKHKRDFFGLSKSNIDFIKEQVKLYWRQK